MNELLVDMKNKYPTFDITSQHLGQIVRDNNKTRKRTRHEHFPNEVGKPRFPLRPHPLIIKFGIYY